jgi:hypothetical protein
MRAGSLAIGLLAAGWIGVIAAFAFGLLWDNKAWYLPPGLFASAAGLGFMQAMSEAEGRGAAIVVGLLSLASAVLCVLAYVFLVFGLV